MFLNTLSQNNVIPLAILHIFFFQLFLVDIAYFFKAFLKMVYGVLIQASQKGFLHYRSKPHFALNFP